MRNLFLITAALLLSACASQSHVAQLYPGAALPKEQVLTIKIPYELEVQSVNGQKMPIANAMFGTNDKTLQLQPGRYQLNVFYRDVFDIDGGLSSEVVRSRSALFTIDGKAGETWQVKFDRPSNVHEARELKNEFNSWIVNTSTGERKEGDRGQRNNLLIGGLVTGDPVEHPSTVAPMTQAQITPASNSHIIAPQPAPVAEAALPSSDATLTTLQNLWQLMSQESRDAFLQWAN